MCFCRAVRAPLFRAERETLLAGSCFFCAGVERTSRDGVCFGGGVSMTRSSLSSSSLSADGWRPRRSRFAGRTSSSSSSSSGIATGLDDRRDGSSSAVSSEPASSSSSSSSPLSTTAFRRELLDTGDEAVSDCAFRFLADLWMGRSSSSSSSSSLSSALLTLRAASLAASLLTGDDDTDALNCAALPGMAQNQIVSESEAYKCIGNYRIRTQDLLDRDLPALLLGAAHFDHWLSTSQKSWRLVRLWP